MLRVAARTCSTSISPIETANLIPLNETTEERVRRIWKNADCVCFDVDSTVCQDEAIDELASYLGVGEAVAAVTATAMNGNARFRDALRARLDVMKPTREKCEQYTRIHKPKITPGIREVVAALHARSVDVYLVSGGFKSIIVPVADILGIDRKKIYANEILFDSNGNYAGFDENELTSDSGSKDVGKAGVCALLKKQHNYRNMVMVGDGATDLEACPPADAFIGFGGNQIRESVRSRAGWYVMNFETLRKELQ